jgi:hypothetical protein
MCASGPGLSAHPSIKGDLKADFCNHFACLTSNTELGFLHHSFGPCSRVCVGESFLGRKLMEINRRTHKLSHHSSPRTSSSGLNKFTPDISSSIKMRLKIIPFAPSPRRLGYFPRVSAFTLTSDMEEKKFKNKKKIRRVFSHFLYAEAQDNINRNPAAERAQRTHQKSRQQPQSAS